jgi:hypothetical protein
LIRRLRAFDAGAWADCVDAPQRRRIQAAARDRPFAALRRQNDSDPAGPCDGLAQPTADAQSAFDDFFER